MTAGSAADRQQPVLVIMGVSGSGKSTVAGLLAGRLGWEFAEGDDMHPDQNVEKMREGRPLTDEDRWPWLETVSSWIAQHTMAGEPGVITCSALKRSYRDAVRGNHVVFIHLVGSKAEIAVRMTARQDHFMPTGLLDSQFATLEPPGPDENVLVVDAGRKPAVEVAEIIARLGLRPAAGPSAFGAQPASGDPR